jgi:hypothetical protein
MQYYNYRIYRKVYGCNMFKDISLIALKRKDWSPHILALKILVYLILKSSFVSSGMRMVDSDENHDRSRRPSVEDQGW